MYYIMKEFSPNIQSNKGLYMYYILKEFSPTIQTNDRIVFVLHCEGF